MDSEKKRIRKKQLIIVIICVVIAAVTLFGLTFTKYTTEDITGIAEYEPALFNTVLLGQLVEADQEALVSTTQEQYAVKIYTCSNDDCAAEIEGTNGGKVYVCPYCGTENTTENPFACKTFIQTVNGKKLSTSLTLNSLTEFGVDTGENHLKIAPGSSEGNIGYIYFTVTNGTTVSDVVNEGTATPQIKNLAQSDIKYKLHIITTNNLPLTYKLIDIDTGITYDLDDTLEQTVTEVISPTKTATYIKKQANSNYVVLTPDEATSCDFVDGSRLLKCNSDNSISVHRYKLKVYWPPVSTVTKIITENETTSIQTEEIHNYSEEYMKELENIQVLVEVESYVNYIQRTEDSDTSSEGIVILSNSEVKDGYFSLKVMDILDPLSYNEVSIFGKKTVGFDSFESISVESFSNETGISEKNAKNYNYKYPFYIYNTESVAANWEADSDDVEIYEDPLNGKSEIRGENGQTNKDGHYAYSSDEFAGNSGYDYHIVVSVPSGEDRMNASGIDWADSDYAYYLEYNGQTYRGVVTSDEVVRSSTQVYNKTIEEYETEEVTEYKTIRFYDSNNQELNLSFPGTDIQKESFTLYRGQETEYTSCKDDLKIYISRTAK